MEETRTPQESKINLIDILIVLLKRKKVLAGITFGAAILSTVFCLVVKPTYRAQTKLLPPQQDTSGIAMQFLGQISGIASGLSPSSLGIKSPGDLYVGMLQGQTIFNKIIDRFDLMKLYKPFIKKWFGLKYYREDCLKDLADVLFVENGTDGMVNLTVDDKDPQRAADMANAFADELMRLNNGLSVTDAARRRLFYEDQLKDAKKALADDEDGMKVFEEKTGALQVDEQAKAVIEGIASIKAMIAAKEVEVKVMTSYTTSKNPDLQKAEEELRELKGQMNKLQARGDSIGHDPLMPTSRMPSVGMEYLRRLRDVKFDETLFELLTKQYELAKMDEAGQASVIQVVDRAVPPDKPVKPKIVLVVPLSTAAGFFLALLAAFFLEYKDETQRNPGTKDRIELLKRYAIFRRKRKD